MTAKSLFFRAGLIFFLIIFQNAVGQATQNSSQCIECHTNLKKLIRLCWEVEKIKPKSKGSNETSGEG